MIFACLAPSLFKDVLSLLATQCSLSQACIQLHCTPVQHSTLVHHLANTVNSSHGGAGRSAGTVQLHSLKNSVHEYTCQNTVNNGNMFTLVKGENALFTPKNMRILNQRIMIYPVRFYSHFLYLSLYNKKQSHNILL